MSLPPPKPAASSAVIGNREPGFASALTLAPAGASGGRILIFILARNANAMLLGGIVVTTMVILGATLGLGTLGSKGLRDMEAFDDGDTHDPTPQLRAEVERLEAIVR